MYQPSEKLTPTLQGILACRVCLVTTGKMFCIDTCGLKQSFFDITGTQVSLGDGLPQHICYVCCALLRKAIEFRNKCHSTQSLLSNLPLTLELMQQINLLHGQQLIRTNVVHVIVGEEVKIEFNDDELGNDLNDTRHTLNNEENYLDDKKKVLKIDLSNFLTSKRKDEEPTTDNDLNDNEDSNDDLTPLLVQQSNLKNKGVKNRKIQKQSKNFKNKNFEVKNKKNVTPKRTSNLSDKEKNQYILNSPYSNPHKKMIHKYMEAKYINNTCNELSLKDEDKLCDVTIITKNNVTYNFDPKVNKYYDYLRDRYGYIDADRDAVRDEVTNRLTDDAVAKKTVKEKYKVKHETKRRQIWVAEMAIEFGKKYNFKVVTFSREEQIKNMRERMETDRYKNAKYKCEDCYTGFQYEDAYNKHRTKHDPVLSGNFECEACKLRFRTETRLNIHMSTCHKYKHICKECGKSFQSRGHAVEHHKRHTGGAQYQCKYCPKLFRWSCHYYEHMRTKHATVACDICHVRLIPSGVSLHMQTQHRETFKCQTCERVFNDSAALDKHIKTSLDEVCNPKDWPCTKCGDNFASESLLIEHILARPKRGRKKGTKGTKTTKAISVPCANKKSKLKIKDKSSSRVMCELCGRTLANTVCLRDHMRIHTGEKPFKCPTCLKSFRLELLLECHIRTHTGEKPYKCPECSKAFSMLYNLRRHQLGVHQNVRPYTCDICNKKFHFKEGVQVHIRTVHMKIPMPPRIRNRKRIVVDREEERTVQPKEKRRVDSEEHERVEGCEEKRDSEEDCEERTEDGGRKEGKKAELLEEWLQDEVAAKSFEMQN